MECPYFNEQNVDNTCSPLLIVVIGERQGWSLALARFWIFVFDGLPHLSTPASNYHLTLINLDLAPILQDDEPLSTNVVTLFLYKQPKSNPKGA